MEEDNQDDSVFKNAEHCTKCCEHMVSIWKRSQFCDVNLVTIDFQGTPTVAIPAHRIVIAAMIPFFTAMFESQMKETTEKEISLHGYDSTAVKILVEYAYTGIVKVTKATAQDLLITADKLGLPDIVKFCADFIGRQIETSNCLGIRDFALLNNLSELHTQAADYTIQNFSSVTSGDEFLELSVEKVVQLVKNDDICVSSEEEVYHAVNNWIQHDFDERLVHADLLYDFVRFPITSQTFLENVASKNPLLQSSKGHVYLKDAFEYHKNPAVIIFANPKKTQPRRSVQGVICVVGGVNDSGDTLNNAILYNPHDKEWKEGPKMKYRRSRLAVTFFQGELYAIGGYDLGYSLAHCEKYSPREKCWKEIASLSTCRRSLAVVPVGNCLFAMGGYTGSVYLQTVEIYNPKADEWSAGPPMLQPRSELAATFLNQCIYAIGGCNSKGDLRSVERFDPINRKWEMIAAMNAPRTGGAVALLGEEIFVSGGMGDKQIINMAEAYDSETNLWEPVVAHMNETRVGLAMVSLGNMVYAIGGSNGLAYLDSVEYYDPSKLKWVISTKLPSPRFASAAVTLSRHELGK